MYYAWLAGFILEFILLYSPVWRIRSFVTPFAVLYVVLSTLWILPELTPPIIVLVSIFALFRLLNLLRIMKGRMHRYYLLFQSRRTFLVLTGLHATVFVVLSTALSYTGWGLFWDILFWIASLLAVGAMVSTLITIQKIRYFDPDRYLTDKNLPTVTVAIPARNETQDLEQCLREVLKSDYPKLEVIVYDDCSQQKTSDIIKSFAHDGVRFIKGEEPTDRWLAKNYAYHRLYESATGELVLFIGVDVRLKANSIRSMVNTMYDRRKRMLSVLPERSKHSSVHALIQPMRYWWELAPPRRLFDRPPVLSTCWMIDRSFLQANGGFSSISHTILPEGYFARLAIKDDSYSFIRSSGDLSVQTQKRYEAQRQTALRVKYPQLRRRIENVLLLTGAELLVFLAPFVGMLIGVSNNSFWLALWSAIGYVSLLVTHIAIISITDPRNRVRAAVLFPLTVIYELVLGYVSMFKYEFGRVDWKDRNVCIPVMHAIPKKDFLASGKLK